MMRLDFEKQNGLIPCIVQDVDTKKVLMLAYMNEESYKKTIETKLATYYSRSRQSLWVKGETSGHYQHVQAIRIDCDQDTILLVSNKLVRLVIRDIILVFIEMKMEIV